MPSDSEDDLLEELEYDPDDDGDAEVEDEALDAAPDDATEDGDDTVSTSLVSPHTLSLSVIYLGSSRIKESPSEDSEDASEEEDEEDEDESQPPVGATSMDIDLPEAPPAPSHSEPTLSEGSRSPQTTQSVNAPSPPPTSRKRSPSPAQLRKDALTFRMGPNIRHPRFFTVEAICALPHPAPTHALASSLCMTHLLTGSDDGYIRDYDIFSAVNGKNFLSAPQRHHAGVVEGLMKAGQVRFWWENPASFEAKTNGQNVEEDAALAPVYSLAMHSDALWTLAGTDSGHINLFTVRHEPGKRIHVMNGHKGPVSALSMDYDEKGFFSAGWDGKAIQWDLNTGQVVRNFTSQGAQLAGIAVRPVNSSYSEAGPPVVVRSSDTEMMDVTSQSTSQTLFSESTQPVEGSSSSVDKKPAESSTDRPPTNQQQDSDVKSEASYDPLFDDDPDEEGGQEADSNNVGSQLGLPGPENQLAMPGQQPTIIPHAPVRPSQRAIPPKNLPPVLDPATYSTYSPDLLMTAAIDGQVLLWDRRVNEARKGVGRLWMNEKTPPWCLSACWSADGGQIYAGRRNGTVDVWDVRQLGRSGISNTPRLLKTLRNPLSSGVVSCVVAFPDGRHIACASVDNLRLWNVAESTDSDIGKSKSGAQFKIIPGHHGGYISQLLLDPGARFLVSASSNRGWHGESTRTVFVHDIKPVY
ncbi:WD40-repeat-containing domain protein [Crucibulum laeve]|uniref:WD40-repeat-containing domain protein n=1 Tax=Crucibulum laeve TaxID=68775 RepID=A0A5C3MDP1_9AGAR|nr:WD40-repeat-containing domain protein [Crucibulum laeve]